MKKYVITSESVTEGHPDKICDQISDAILDNLIAQDPDSRVAIECLVTTGSVHIAGEVTTRGFFDAQRIARETLKEIGYTNPKFGIDYEDAGVWVSIHGQSPDISQGVSEGQGEDKEQGAGDQGCLKKGTLVRTKNGFIPIENIKPGDFVITPFGLKKVLNSKKTGIKSIIEIECINGMRLGCTPKHKIFCYNKHRENYWKEAKKLSRNDYICILKSNDYFINQYFKSFVPKKSFFSKYNHRIYGPEEVIFNEELGYITGLLIGDGYVKKRNTMEICFGKDKELAWIVQKILEKQFPKQWRIIKTSDEIICLKIDSVLVRKHFENFGVSYEGSPKKTTPNKIFISPKNVIKSYLRGLFDSDGTIIEKTGRTKDNVRIRLSSSSLKLLEETQLLLNDFSIKSSILFNVPKGKEVRKDKRYKSNYDNYVLSLIGFESYQNFAKEISFLNPRKNERLRNYIKNNTIKPRNSRSIFLIPHPIKNEMIGEEKIGKDLSFAITKIKNKIKKGKSDVYDLEIKDVNMFSGNGLFIHNSMYGYACNETQELMPLPITLAHKLTQRLAVVRKTGIIKGLGPDGKSQVSVEYEDNKPKRVTSVVIAQQHIDDISEEILRKEIFEKVILPVCKEYMDEETKIHINATGRFVIGGPEGDTGVTGRKIVVDTYGGVGRVGGGCFSGKDPSKVDRSGAYAARYIAKNIVGAGLADKCEVQLSYCIGISKPTSINIDCFGTNKIPEEKISQLVYENFDLRPKAIIKNLNLKRPIYKKTAAYGHFGRNDADFSWERLDKVEILRNALEEKSPERQKSTIIVEERR